MFGWLRSKKKLRKALSELTARYMTLSANSSEEIEQLEVKLAKVRQGRNAHVKELEADLTIAKSEAEFVIGAFRSEIHQIKTDLHRLRIEDDMRGIEADLVRSQARAFYILGQSESIPWEELEKQVRLLERLMALRQEYQQT